MSTTDLKISGAGNSIDPAAKFEMSVPSIDRSHSPVHVVYGGADRFSADTPKKLGSIALDSINRFAPNLVEFALALRLPGSERLPVGPSDVSELEEQLSAAPDRLEIGNYSAWFAWNVFRKTIDKLKREPVEDLRIDFEDGYGFRSSGEEDGHAIAAASELASAFLEKRITEFSGIRVRSFATRQSRNRAARTIDLFVSTLLDKTGGDLPRNFCVTLPKVTDDKQVSELCRQLASIERKRGIPKGSIAVELMIETPESLISRNGQITPRSLVDAAKGRCTSVHFGAYDYTSALGISASYQDIRHPACIFARQLMQTALAGSGVRLVDSVTIELPIPLHRSENLSDLEKSENKRSVHSGWLRHFNNVTASMAEGFYQSWDLHPNQLVARYAAVYSFFLSEMTSQAQRLRSILERTTRAGLTGSTFDDAASAEGVVNFFKRGLSCRAFDENQVKQLTGLNMKDLETFSLLPPGHK